ncbi:hypothetical protein Trydic_g10839 [Trypoxylus dichotomus]
MAREGTQQRSNAIISEPRAERWAQKERGARCGSINQERKPTTTAIAATTTRMTISTPPPAAGRLEPAWLYDTFNGIREITASV